MSTEWLCGWAARDILEGMGWDKHSAGPPANFSITYPAPSVPTGIAMPAALTYGGATQGNGGQWLNFQVQDGTLQGFIRPTTNPIEPGTVKPQIAGICGTGGNGAFLSWGADKKFYVVDFLGTTVWLGPSVTTMDAASPQWYVLQLQYNISEQTVTLRIYKESDGFTTPETLGPATASDFSIGPSIQVIRRGQLSGNPTAGWHWTNELLELGATWPDPKTSLAAVAVNSGPGADNQTSWVRSDTGLDDATNEYTLIDEIPPDDTDYLKRTVNVATLLQYYGHAAGLVPAGQTPLAVQAVARNKSVTNAQIYHQCGLKLSASTILGTRRRVGEVGSGVAGAWAYPSYVCSSVKPGGGAWTIADVDNVRPGHGSGTATTGEAQCAHHLIYAAYTGAAPPQVPTERRRAHQVI